MESVRRQVEARFAHLSGARVQKSSGYEECACRVLGFTCDKSRYWDCTFDGSFIELKKGKSIWLDEIRYSETFAECNEECKRPTITLFLIPNTSRTRVEAVYIVDTQNIVRFLRITSETVAFALERKRSVKRSINMQQSMTLKDLRNIATHEISALAQSA